MCELKKLFKNKTMDFFYEFMKCFVPQPLLVHPHTILSDLPTFKTRMRTFDTQYRAKSKHKELESFKRFVDEPFDFQIVRRESPRKRVLRAEL